MRWTCASPRRVCPRRVLRAREPIVLLIILVRGQLFLLGGEGAAGMREHGRVLCSQRRHKLRAPLHRLHLVPKQGQRASVLCMDLACLVKCAGVH